MKKTLKASFQKNCIGCEMCVAEAQKQLGKVGLEGSPIRIFRNRNEKGKIEFSVDIDPMINDLDLERVLKICPALVFTIEDKEENGLTE